MNTMNGDDDDNGVNGTPPSLLDHYLASKRAAKRRRLNSQASNEEQESGLDMRNNNHRAQSSPQLQQQHQQLQQHQQQGSPRLVGGRHVHQSMPDLNQHRHHHQQRQQLQQRGQQQRQQQQRQHQWTSQEAVHPSGHHPVAQLLETPSMLRLSLDVPGVDAQDIDVTIQHGVLQIKGVRNTFSVDGRMVIKQLEFTRRFAIDTSVVDVEHVKANLSRGVLVVAAPKKSRPKCFRIPVTEEESVSWNPFQQEREGVAHQPQVQGDLQGLARRVPSQVASRRPSLQAGNDQERQAGPALVRPDEATSQATLATLVDAPAPAAHQAEPAAATMVPAPGPGLTTTLLATAGTGSARAATAAALLSLGGSTSSTTTSSSLQQEDAQSSHSSEASVRTVMVSNCHPKGSAADAQKNEHEGTITSSDSDRSTSPDCREQESAQKHRLNGNDSSNSKLGSDQASSSSVAVASRSKKIN